jgi:hypothetical protein
MTTKRQRAWYWREWGKVAAAQGWARTDDVARHELHVQALGIDKSHRALTNGEFDRVMGAFLAITRPADLTAQLRQEDQPRQRLLHYLETFGLGQQHVRAVCRGKFGTEDWRDFPLSALERLRGLVITEANRARSAARREAAAGHPF